MRSRVRIGAIAGSLVFLVLAGCGGGRRADLVVLNGAEPETLDPAIITGQPEGRIAYALFEGLTAFNERGEPGPGVAERWEISPDGRTYVFHLRADARWSDGRRVTAEDFARSWRRTLEPGTASEYAYQLHYLVGARAFNEGTETDFSKVGVRATDAATLEVRLENPTPFFLDLCAFVTLLPVPVDLIAQAGDDWIKPGRIAGNGAYVLEAWRINDRIRLRRNPHYWGRDRVAMETVDIIPVSNANTAFNYYASGMADVMLDKGLVPLSMIDVLRGRPDFHSAPFLGTCFLRFNCTRPPFGDARVRRAFSLVMDRERLVGRVTRAGEPPAYSFVPPGTGSYTPPRGLARDIAEARRLLAEAGFPGGRGFPVVYYLYSEGEVNDAVAVELQDTLRAELGVPVQLLRQEWKVYLNSMGRLDYDLCRSSWVGDYNDPNTFLDLFLAGGGNNRTGWKSPPYDRLIAAAAAELDREKRLDLFRQAEELLLAEAPVCPLYFYVGIQFYQRDRLGGLEANLLDEHPVRTLFWK